MVHRQLGGHLQLLACGGAALPAETQRLWDRLGVNVLQGYGTSECSPIISCSAADRARRSAAWQAADGVQVHLSAEGELQVKGPNVMRGYWQDAARTAEVLDIDGWYATGDLARIDPGGDIWLLGRARDLIVLPSGTEGLAGGRRGGAARTSGHSRCSGGGGSRGWRWRHIARLSAARFEPDRTADLSTILAQCNGQLAQHQRLASASWWDGTDFPRTNLLKVRRHLLPRPAAVTAVHVESVLAADDPVGQAIAGAAGVAAVQPDQTLSGLGLDSLALVDLTLNLEEKTEVDSRRRPAAGHDCIQGTQATAPSGRFPGNRRSADRKHETQRARRSTVAIYLGCAWRFLNFPIDLLYRFGAPRIRWYWVATT